jgi:hypothetical protein
MSNNKRIFIVVDEALHIARLLDDHVVVCTDDVAPARKTAFKANLETLDKGRKIQTPVLILKYI